MKSSRVSRIVNILTTLQAGKHCTVEELAETFGTSRRTVFRDLKELQTIGVPYHYDSQKGSYAIDPDFFLPPIDLNHQEALSLLILAHKIGAQIQLPYRNSALLAALKIENNLSAETKRFCNSILNNISIRLHPQAKMKLLDKTFKQLQKAIRYKRKVKVLYHSLSEGKDIDLELSPYHLLYNQRTWYVLALSSLHNTIKIFELNRIRDIEVQNKCYIEKRSFNLTDYVGRAWSMNPEGAIYHVKLRFLPEIAADVTEVQWHSTQKVTYENDGSAIVEFRVDGLGEITWWILSYGDKVQVIAPKSLRERVLQINRNSIELNENIQLANNTL